MVRSGYRKRDDKAQEGLSSIDLIRKIIPQQASEIWNESRNSSFCDVEFANVGNLIGFAWAYPQHKKRYAMRLVKFSVDEPGIMSKFQSECLWNMASLGD